MPPASEFFAMTDRPLNSVAAGMLIGLATLFCLEGNCLLIANDATLQSQIEPLIAAHDGSVAVAIKHLQTGAQYYYRADEVMPTASLIKLPVMVAAYRSADAGALELDSRIQLKEEDRVPGSGILSTHFSAGTTLPMRDAIRLMIAYSDNTATNLVVNGLGLATTNSVMNELGLMETKLHSLVYRRDTSILPERSEQYGLGSTTAAETMRLLEMLHRGELANSEGTTAMISHLTHCDDTSKLCRYLPNVKFAHKTGAVNGVRCDAGWMETPAGRIALCVLTSQNKDQSWGPDNEAEILCGRIAEVTFKTFNSTALEVPTENDRPLKLGASGALVEDLQRTLNQRLEPSPRLQVDGDFGPATEAAVVRFQTAHQLSADGIVTPETWQVLGKIVDSSIDADQEDLPKLLPKDSLTGPPIVTCRAWCVVDGDSGRIIDGDSLHHALEPASTTKMLTALLVLRWASSDPTLLDERVVFSQYASDTEGSSSTVRAGESLPVRDLLYGLLLPSGNDAATALAEHFGAKQNANASASSADNVLVFVNAMNALAEKLGLQETHFENPHGLPSSLHRSSAHDLAILGYHAVQDNLFRQIVGTRRYRCTVVGPAEYQRSVQWDNTNRLLGIEGFAGIKTGTTKAAGACLVASETRQGRTLIVSILGSSSSDSRYVDARNLLRWAWNAVAE